MDEKEKEMMKVCMGVIINSVVCVLSLLAVLFCFWEKQTPMWLMLFFSVLASVSAFLFEVRLRKYFKLKGEGHEDIR